MKGFARTDIGKARDMNQDYYYIPSSENDLQIYILADGMGGYNGGEIASKLAVQTVREYIENNFDKIEHTKEEILNMIKKSMENANSVVYEESKKDDNLQGMGTTLDVCLIYNNKIFIGHVGDSRIYRIRQNVMRKLTKDHSYVQKLIEDGTITREEAMTHPKKNMLMKALGCTPYVEPDVRARNYIVGDILIMCSDGLTNMVKEEEIYKTVIEDAVEAPKKLIEQANKLGGYDNITVITIL